MIYRFQIEKSFRYFIFVGVNGGGKEVRENREFKMLVFLYLLGGIAPIYVQ